MTNYEYQTKPETIKAILFDGSFESTIEVMRFVMEEAGTESTKIEIADAPAEKGKRAKNKNTVRMYTLRMAVGGYIDTIFEHGEYIVKAAVGWTSMPKDDFEKAYIKGNPVAKLRKENEELREALLDL